MCVCVCVFVCVCVCVFAFVCQELSGNMSKREKIVNFLYKLHQLQNINYQILTGKIYILRENFGTGCF